MNHIIEVSKESEQRHLQPRRLSDLTVQEKSRKFDALMKDCEFQADYYSKEYLKTGDVYALGAQHGFLRVLWYVGAAECERIGGAE